jgi:uncharacterized membrane protein
MDGRANGFSTKEKLWYYTLFLAALAAGLYLLVRNIASIDPKKAAGTSRQIYQKMAIAVVCLLSWINIVIVYSAKYNGHNTGRLLYPFLGLFFVFLGNMMHSVKPNYFVGIRSPWALEDESNWRATHRLGSKIYFAGGLLIIIGTLLFPPKASIWILEGTVVVMALAPILYSFLYFKRRKS